MDKKKQNAGALIVAGFLAVMLIVCVVLLVVRLSGRIEDGVETWQEQKQMESEKEPTKPPTVAPTKAPTVLPEETPTTVPEEPTETPTAVPTETTGEPESEYNLKRISYEVVYKLSEDALLVWKFGNYGIVNGKGEPIVEIKYPYVEYYDEEWVTFSDDTTTAYVYDTKGNLLYTYTLWEDGLFTENGIEYTRMTCYKRGLKTEMVIGTEDNEYYGVRYYNAETDELIFEAVGGYEDVAVSSLPDETGTAVVIQNGESEIIVNRITKDGYTTDSRWYFDVDIREFYYSDFIGWTQPAMSDGWLFTTLCEIKDADREEYEWVQAVFNTNKFAIMPLPEEYQNTYADIYTLFKGDYYGVSTVTEEEYYGEYPETMYYAICYRNQKLTEEIYTWMTFEENYILAGNETTGHILDYNGKVLKEYVNIASDFMNGKLVVYDGKDVYLLDEALEVCSGPITSDISYCMPGGVWKGLTGYLILE